MSEDAVRNQLAQLGFSDAEMSIYLVVLRQGEATVAEIAAATDISTRYVYERLDTIAGRGVVDVLDHESPTVVRARPPEEAIDDLVAGLRDVSTDLSALYSEPDPPEVAFDLCKSPDTTIKRVRSLLAEASEEVVVALPASRAVAVADELRAAVDRGVFVLLLVGENRTESADGDLDGCYSALRVWEHEPPVMVASDVIAGLIAPAGFLTRGDGDSAVFVRQDQLVANVVGSFLGNYWPLADEWAVREPSSLPRTFSNFRHAVFEAAIQQRAQRSVGVAIDGFTTAGDERQVEGPLVDIAQGLVEPRTSRFPIEMRVDVDTGDDTVSVGGTGAFLEDLVAVETTLLTD
jgi:sugar-specific transcriptional regulator TrmB